MSRGCEWTNALYYAERSMRHLGLTEEEFSKQLSILSRKYRISYDIYNHIDLSNDIVRQNAEVKRLKAEIQGLNGKVAQFEAVANAKAAQSEAVAKQQWDAGYNAGLAAAKQAAAKAIGKLARPDPNGSGSR